MKYADKHKLSPDIGRLFLVKQSDFVDKSGREGVLGISRGGCRLWRRF